ncbi:MULTISPECIES: recombinase family protein [unclassified Lysobacter]|uniref:recombinase family protein n=1 Tax=unclassified Lysobacter TaxID=2635362 RepID=UPI001BE848B7|nr:MULTISPECIES: recombinase family protein [unclassified Lysobacter]MBT2748264.1 recombinase family protein [Lysobacter sp. ISL-42]MBT2749969.1 recombinase family protein [Lysobacter sp. ISL-50]MBT2781297.1 recombinase family protein [Lysobacter sp. ISL-52]
MNTLHIAIYCQSSQPDAGFIAHQQQGISSVIDRCAGSDFDVRHYADDGYCAETMVRPAFQRLLLDAAGGVIDCIAVTDWARLAPTDSGVQRLQRYFHQCGVLVVECRIREGVLVRIAA